MAASRTLGAWRNISSSSRHTLQSLPEQVALRPAFPALRPHSTLGQLTHSPRSAALLPLRVHKRGFRTASLLYTRAPTHNDVFIPESSSSSSGEVEAADDATSIPVTGERTPIGQIEQRLSITFTCTADACGHRSSHEFSKRSYTKGIVIVQCPGCKNRHLIADNLSWFTESADEPRTIEQMIEAKGGKVTRGTLGADGETIEILS